MAEIRIERKQRGVLPWILGLALVALVVIGFVLVLADRDAGRLEKVEEAREAGNVQEAQPEQPKKDKTPRHLQQWVFVQESDTARAA
ncbi:MAG TPA: hypothetical protein VJ885_13685 [Thermoanaerobaculia bacterium]|nr:hypothetical protein [Thermoanaerobaculia bacterium]